MKDTVSQSQAECDLGQTVLTQETARVVRHRHEVNRSVKCSDSWAIKVVGKEVVISKS